eukprot:3668086-Ditylum_brightwellii.AAC.1
MASSAKMVQWHNGVQNHQNRHLLLVLDPKVTGYEAVELFQWEMCLQFHSQGASIKVPTVDVGDKVKKIIILLHETHGKDKFTIFSEAGKWIKIETFSKKAPEIKTFLNYEVRENYKNILLVLHVMSLISYHAFKTPMMPWLIPNRYYMAKMIFKSSKDAIVQISHLTNLNPFQTDCIQYQEMINGLIEAVAINYVKKDPKFFELYNTTKDHVKFDIQLRPGHPAVRQNNKKIETDAFAVYVRHQFSNLSLALLQEIAPLISSKYEAKFVLISLKFNTMIKDNVMHYANLIKEENAYLGNYADFKIGQITEEMLSHDVSRKSVKENTLVSPFIIDLHQTTFTNKKFIWIIKMTKEDLHQAIKEIETSLKALVGVFPKEMFNKIDAYPKPRIIPEYGISYSYTAHTISNMLTTVNDEKKNYSKLPPNTWSQGPPKTTTQKNPTGNKNTNPVNNTSSNNSSGLYKKSPTLENNYKELKQCIEES